MNVRFMRKTNNSSFNFEKSFLKGHNIRNSRVISNFYVEKCFVVSGGCFGI
jgi:hypothetical protein